MLPFTETLNALKSLLPPNLQSPRVGIVCGSGLAGLASCLREVIFVPYDQLPGFAEITGELSYQWVSCMWLNWGASVPGHKSSLAFGLMGSGEGIPVVAMLGRVCSRLSGRND